jgi:hypothetical protein
VKLSDYVDVHFQHFSKLLPVLSIGLAVQIHAGIVERVLDFPFDSFYFGFH